MSCIKVRREVSIAGRSSPSKAPLSRFDSSVDFLPGENLLQSLVARTSLGERQHQFALGRVGLQRPLGAAHDVVLHVRDVDGRHELRAEPASGQRWHVDAGRLLGVVVSDWNVWVAF